MTRLFIRPHIFKYHIYFVHPPFCSCWKFSSKAYFLWAIILRVNSWRKEIFDKSFFSPLQFVPLHRGTKMSWCPGETPSIPLFFFSIFVNLISKIEFLQRAIHALPCQGSLSSFTKEAGESWMRISSFLYSFLFPFKWFLNSLRRISNFLLNSANPVLIQY